MTKTELLTIPRLRASIIARKRLLAKLEEESTCLPNFRGEDRVLVSPQNTSMVICHRIVDLEKEITEDEEKLDRLRGGVQDLLLSADSLCTPERILIRLRYVDGASWNHVADFLGYTYRHTLRLHKRILDVIFGSD